MMRVEYRYFAVKPLRAEHPVGSGLIVEYKPGEEVPAGEWGRAADNLVELGKAARVAFNVSEGDDVPAVAYGETLREIEDSASHVTRPKRGPGRPKKVVEE